MRLKRTPLTWYCYLLSGFFTVVLNIQGNILPFLREELSLSYRAVSLHPSAIACGMIISGAITGHIVKSIGRRRALQVGIAGTLLGTLMLVAAPSVVVSVAGCLLVGLTGAMMPGIIAGLLAQVHGEARNQAYAECGAMTYACVVVSSLAAGAVIGWGLGWRAAMLFGAALGLILAAAFFRTRVPDPLPRPVSAAGVAQAGLPLPSILFMVTLGLGVALEYSVLLWSPAYLEHEIGLTRADANTAAAAYSVAMLLGRLGGSVVVRRVAPLVLYPLALSVVVPGFILYWVIATPVLAIAGVFLLGLAISLLYPLAIGLTVSAAGPLGDLAGTRSGYAAGTALLLSPLVLGGLADAVGLRMAHLAIPAIAVAILSCFSVARILQRRMVVHAAPAQ